MPANFEDRLLTVSELADVLKVQKSWIYDHTRMRGLSRIPHIKLGKYLRFEMSAVQLWLKQLADESIDQSRR